NSIKSSVQEQVGSIHPIAVSTTRYQRGIEREQALFVEKSGIPQLRTALAKAIMHVPEKRQAEKERLYESLSNALNSLIQTQNEKVITFKGQAIQQERGFPAELLGVVEQSAADLRDIMQAPGVDEASDPGTIDAIYRVTAGKSE